MQETPKDAEPRDDALVAALTEGDTAALGQLYERHGATILGILRRYARSLPEAEIEDLRQEVFLTALTAAHRFGGRGSVRSWLCGIAIRSAQARSRRRTLRRRLLKVFGGRGPGFSPPREDPVAGPVEARLDATRALAKLTETQREVLLLHVVEGLSGSEIATALEVNEKTVWTRLHRARKGMREALATQ